MQKIYLLLIIGLISIGAQAQRNGSIKGIAFDTLSKQPIASATITLLHKKDSSLVTFTMTDNRGNFELTGIANGDYRLLITHVNYHNTSRMISVTDAAKNVDLSTIILRDLSQTLDEVVVTAEAPPVTLIGDTIQYNAGSFKTPPNADVEQLLKKMPGIKVEKDGTVKAQGQKVNRVLVDGKEFFGTDPKIATKNLPADAVDKVQVYDRLSDAAQLTGFDDGNSEKTINLKLKQDKKKGMFGKAMAGGGTDGRYEGKFNVNSFKGARQFSVIGMGNNVNAEGFSFLDMLNFTGEMGRLLQGGTGGNISLTVNNNDPIASLLGSGNGNGIKTIWGGGVNYNNLIGNKTDFTSNYFYNRYNPLQESVSQRTYFLPDSFYYYNQHSISNNLNNSQRLNMSADIRIDSFNSLKIIPSFGYQETRNSVYNDYQTLSKDGVLANEGFSNNNSTGRATNFRNEILYRKKFRRKGRTFSFDLQSSLNNSESDGSLLSVNNFFSRGVPLPGNDSINQHNTTSGSFNSYAARAVYTEPIFRRSLLEFSLGHSDGKSSSDKKTWDFNQLNNKYDQLNAALSNDFESEYGYTNAGIRLRTQQKHFSLAGGVSWQESDLKGRVLTSGKDSTITKTFYNLLPSLRLKYEFTRYRSLNINYAASTNQPSITQLQPVPDISDPLNIKAGNPNLKQEFNHAVQVNFVSVNPFKNRNLFAFFNVQETQDKIVNYDVVDSLGVKRTTYVNVNGVYNVTGTVSLGLPLHIWHSTINISSNMGYAKSKQFINTVQNNIGTATLGPELRLDMSPTDKLDISLIAGYTYYRSTYSLQPSLDNNYFTHQYEAEVNWQLPAHFYFNSNLTYTINGQRAAGYNTKVPLWNASFSRQFLRFNRGELKLTVFDMLNQNVGISRTANQNYIDDTRIKNLQRYFMLTFTFSLSKNGLSSDKQQGGIFIRK